MGGASREEAAVALNLNDRVPCLQTSLFQMDCPFRPSERMSA